MAAGPRYFVRFRRRREGRTDYYRRMKLIVSDRPRMVVRRTNRQIIVQLVTATMEGDLTLVAARSAELEAFGYSGSLSNTPAAYLTGMLFAVKALNEGYEGANLDIGLARASRGSRVFAALKGAVSAGLDVPHSPEVLPGDDRTNGAHIAAYQKETASDLITQVGRAADGIMKELR